jgi:hypothetical protein
MKFPLCVSSERASERKSVVGIVLFSSFSSHVLSCLVCRLSLYRSLFTFTLTFSFQHSRTFNVLCFYLPTLLHFTSLHFISLRFALKRLPFFFAWSTEASAWVFGDGVVG